MKWLLLSLVLFVSCDSSQKISGSSKSEKEANTLPIWLNCYPTVSPVDSLKEFITIYLEINKKKVLSTKEAVEMMIGQQQDIITKNISDDMTKEKIVSVIEKNSKPVCNLLQAQLYKNTSPGEEVIIDSIKWSIIQKPSRDSGGGIQMFYPKDRKQGSLYPELKRFIDAVLASKLLK